MAISQEDNDLMTRVEGEAPLGKMLRQHYWLPAIPGEKLEKDGRPYRVRLLGEDYVVFRNTDGAVGILDEQCPHRRASLALGQNRENGLRCIYHGWKFDVEGNLVDAPNVENNAEQFCKSVKLNRYKAVERGGIIWVWLGQGDEAPPFPALPFVDLPPENRSVTSVQVETNFLQGVEASMDTTHVSFLHSSTTELLSGNTMRKNMLKKTSARLEFEDRPYGFRYAAIRELNDSEYYVRVNNFVMPWYAIICAPEKDGPSTVFFSVPIDDTTHRAWFVHFNPVRPLGLTVMSTTPDTWNFPPNPPGTADENWGQDRTLMKRGHFSGFAQHLATEDFAMFLSQGPIFDRTKEQLCASDGAIMRLRHQILKSVREFQKGETPKLAQSTEQDYSRAVSIGDVVADGKAWKTMVA